MPPKDQNAAPSRSAGEKQARDERQRECAEVDDDYWNLLKDRKFVRWDSGMACRTQEARDNRVDDSAEDHRKRINEQEKQVDEAAEGMIGTTLCFDHGVATCLSNKGS